MSTRTPKLQDRSQYHRSWGNFASSSFLPNAVSAPLAAPDFSDLEVGDTAFSIVDGLTYTCTAVGTVGGGDAVWSSGSAQLFLDSYISGRYYPLGLGEYANALGTIAGFADRLDLYPFIPKQTISPAELGCYVTALVGGAEYKMLTYASDGVGGAPGTLSYSSPAIAASASPWLPETLGLPTYELGRLYWIGVVHSSTATLRGLPLSSARTFGGMGTASPPAGAIVGSVIRRVSAGQFVTPPNPFGPLLSTEIANNTVPPALIALAP